MTTIGAETTAAAITKGERKPARVNSPATVVRSALHPDSKPERNPGGVQDAASLLGSR